MLQRDYAGDLDALINASSSGTLIGVRVNHIITDIRSADVGCLNSFGLQGAGAAGQGLGCGHLQIPWMSAWQPVGKPLKP